MMQELLLSQDGGLNHELIFTVLSEFSLLSSAVRITVSG